MIRPRVLPTALIATALLAGCSAAAKTDAPSPPAVEIATAGAPVPSAAYRGPGSVRAAHTYRLAFQIPGRVTGVFADVGDRVASGAPLAQLDSTDYRAQLDEASARAGQARAQAARTYDGARPQERAQADQSVIAARSAVARARAALDLAAANDRRMQSLVVSGDVAQQQADTTHAALRDAQANYDGAQAQLASAEQNNSLVDVGARQEDRRAAAADVSAADAAVALANATLAKTTLVAPADAFVLTRDVEPGNAAEPGIVVFTLTDAAAPEVAVELPELQAADVHAGTPATIVAGVRRIAARVARIEPNADPTTRTVEVRLRAAGLDLRPGAVVTVAIGERPAGGATVPYGAIVQSAGGAYVMRYDDRTGSVERMNVLVAESDGQVARVTGIRPGERIVTMGQREAVPGKPVHVVADEAER